MRVITQVLLLVALLVACFSVVSAGTDRRPMNKKLATLRATRSAPLVPPTDSYTNLVDGVTIKDSAGQGQLVYYLFQTQATSLNITVTQITGDPDLFVSVINPYPNWTNFTWASLAWGVDQVVISSTDPNVCVPSTKQPVCSYYIGVFGFMESIYTIVAHGSK